MNNNEDLALRAREAVRVAGQAAQGELPQTAGAMQIRARYTTAVQIIRPRELREVLRKCLEEAALAGESMYYSWSQGGEIIEGPSVQCTNIAARQFGNCAVETIVEETPDAYIFYGSFIDLETGFNYTRPFRMSKAGPKKRDGTAVYKDERGKDIVFQIGASKASRNAVANAVPRWIIDEMVIKAKENVVEQIRKMGPEKARQKVQARAAALGISMERLEAKAGKAKAWSEREIVTLSSSLRAVEDGVEAAEDLFPGSVGSAEVVNEPVTQPTEKAPEVVKTHPEEVGGFEQAIDEVKNQEEAKAVMESMNAAHSESRLNESERNALVERLAAREGTGYGQAQKESGTDLTAGFNPLTEVMGFGKHKDKTWAECPPTYLQWIVDNVGDKQKVAKAKGLIEAMQNISPA